MINFKNKKAAEEILSPWMFFIWIVIASGVLVGISVFYNNDFDLRQKESEILNSMIYDCFVNDESVLNEFYDSKSEINPELVINSCGLNYSILNSDDFYIDIKIYEEDSNNIYKFFKIGNENFEVWCSGNFKGENIPRCSLNSFSVFVDVPIRVEILTASNNKGEKLL